MRYHCIRVDRAHAELLVKTMIHDGCGMGIILKGTADDDIMTGYLAVEDGVDSVAALVAAINTLAAVDGWVICCRGHEMTPRIAFLFTTTPDTMPPEKRQ